MKTTFVILETANCGADQTRTEIRARSLAAAKMVATKKQVWMHSHLCITNYANKVLAYKGLASKHQWVNS